MESKPQSAGTIYKITGLETSLQPNSAAKMPITSGIKLQINEIRELFRQNGFPKVEINFNALGSDGEKIVEAEFTDNNEPASHGKATLRPIDAND